MTKENPDKPLPPGTIEHELGLPVPGVILPPEKWTVSALKEWPPGGVIDWEQLFGRRAPVVVDVGCGNGRSVLLGAITHPEQDFLGLDNLPLVIRYARKRARQRGLGNVRFAVGDARDVVARLVPPHSLAEVCIYHPQPYYDPAEVHRRLITPLFLAQVHRSLAPGGLLVLQTDNPAYWRYIRQVVPAFFVLHEQSGPWPDAPQGRTRREIIARQRGLPIFRALAEARGDLDVEAARQAAEALPPPVFDADRRLLELDALESGGDGGDEPVATGRPARQRRRRLRRRGRDAT
jgi:tRNA (guanine-N7-)-methyltransferase